MTAHQHLAAAMERARALPPECAPAWPAGAPPAGLVAWLLAEECARLGGAISQGFVRAKAMRGGPEKPAPRTVT